MRSKVLIIPLFTLILGGCLVGPNYRPPAPVICNNWTSGQAASEALCVSSCEEPPTAWWQIFGDPLLDKYIAMAARHNNDLLSANAAICQAKAVRKVTAAPLFPHINADPDILRTYFSENGLLALLPEGAAALAPAAPKPKRAQTIYNLLWDASWEIDLFGKTRRAIEAANANIGSAVEQRNDVLLSIFAEVALNYIQLRSNQSLGQLIEENIGILENYTELVQKQYKAGYRNLLDLEQQEAALAQAVAQLPDVLAQIFQNIYALSVLTGNLPETLMCELLPIQPLPLLPKKVALGVRSDLVRRRPDVRQAERQMAAAVANIGVAVAQFFPSFNLLGDIGYSSLRLHKLLEQKSYTWALFGDLRIPLFQGGKLVGNLRANQAQAREAAFNYQQTVLNAIEEAEGTLISYAQEIKTSEELQEAASRYERLVGLTQQRFAKGLVSMTDLLTIESQWNGTEQNLLASETTALLDLIKLYKALGGGWQCQ